LKERIRRKENTKIMGGKFKNKFISHFFQEMTVREISNHLYLTSPMPLGQSLPQKNERRNNILRRTKFNVAKDTEKRTYDGIVFDSILEMKYYRDILCPLVKSGDVVNYELQKPYELQPKFIHDNKTVQPIKYVADFYIIYKDGHEEVIDTKGCPDSVAILKRKLFWYRYPDVDYKWVTWVKKFGGWIDYEEYKQLKREEKKSKIREI